MSELKNDEAESRGGLPFTSYDDVHHWVSGPSLGLGFVSGLGPFWKNLVAWQNRCKVGIE